MAQPFPSRDGRRRLGGWLGLLLLAFNVVLGPLAVGDGSLARPIPLAAELAGDMVICTSQGMVVLDRDGHPRAPGGQTGHDGFCVFCLPLAHAGSGAVPAPAIAPLPLRLVAEVVRPEPVFAPQSGRHRDPNPARAPPRLA